MKNQNPYGESGGPAATINESRSLPIARKHRWLYFWAGFAICFFFVLPLVGVVQTSGGLGGAEANAQFQCMSISHAVRAYCRKCGEWPSTLNDLVVKPEHMQPEQWQGPYLEGGAIPIDSWARPFVLISNEEQEAFVVISAGPDGEFGGSDDIIAGSFLAGAKSR